MPRVSIPPKRGSRKIPETRVVNPGRGLNTLISDNLIKDEEASALNNVVFVESGAITKGPGLTAVGSGLTVGPKGLAAFYPGSNRYLLTVDGTALKYLNGTNWTAISGATFTTDQEVNFVQGEDTLYIWDGNAAGCSLDSALTLTRLTTAPRASFGIYYQSYQIVSGVDTKPNRLYISDSTTNLGDFTNNAGTLSTAGEVPGATVFAAPGTTGANFVDVNDGDGDKITGFAKYQGVLIIFKERSIYQMSIASDGTPTVTQVTGSSGCVSHKSIDNVENDIFYLSRRGYYVLGSEPNYFNSIRSNELSSRINPTIQTILPANLDRVCSIFSDFRFYSSITSGSATDNNKTLVYDRRYLSWSQLDYIKANAFTEYIDSNGAKHLYFASDDEAKVYEIVEGNYNVASSTAINASWTSKAFDIGKFDLNKRWIDMSILVRQISGTVNLTIYSDSDSIVKSTSIGASSSASGALGDIRFGASSFGGAGLESSGLTTNNVVYRLKINKKSRTIKVKFDCPGLNDTFTILGFVFTYVPYNHYSFDSSYKIY
jgi:hypothetical protein